MKLKQNQIEKISNLIVKNLKEKKLANFIVKDSEIQKKICDIILKNVQTEEEIEKETELLLEKFSDQFSSGEIEYKKMFDLTKKKIAEKKGFVL
jgi:hypothetical protein